MLGSIQGKQVLVLIDSRASHNFISVELVRTMGIEAGPTPTVSYGVRLGDGQCKETNGCCRDLMVCLGEQHTAIGDFFLFDLGGVDVVLGIAWLATLGETRVNWKTLTVRFQFKDERVEIRGEPGLSKSLIPPQALMKIMEIETVSFLWDIALEEKEPKLLIGKNLTKVHRGQLQQLMKKHHRVFEEPEGLPPRRDIDHHIPIKVGVNPVNLRPYRYPHLQQNEIEKQAKDMLSSGIIRPSNSPYLIQ